MQELYRPTRMSRQDMVAYQAVEPVPSRIERVCTAVTAVLVLVGAVALTTLKVFLVVEILVWLPR